jgi:hypothetical protein
VDANLLSPQVFYSAPRLADDDALLFYVSFALPPFFVFLSLSYKSKPKLGL